MELKMPMILMKSIRIKYFGFYIYIIAHSKCYS